MAVATMELELDYQQRLLAAAEIILQSDRRDEGAPLLDLAHTWRRHRHPQTPPARRRLMASPQAMRWALERLCKQYPVELSEGQSQFNRTVLGAVSPECHRWLDVGICEILSDFKGSSGQLELPFDVLLTTYDLALLDQDFLSQIPWHYVVVDEAQRLKNPSSVLYSVLQQHFIMPRRLLMTGTPIQNNLTELWALMHFCMPGVFGKLEQFTSTFYAAGSSSTGVVIFQFPFSAEVYGMVVQLRKACSHPYLFIGIEPEPYEEGEHLIHLTYSDDVPLFFHTSCVDTSGKWGLGGMCFNSLAALSSGIPDAAIIRSF
ncbi:hypothetical protein J5N97_018502 [Dioscorea zingiberensis]|uniref:Helicase ATP-binding domain-containing protein n=1 Tax=Dioscorea zingiberensis TaxID=325984 RepID=A0A9D5CC96_9LILI|nr:hypothetical protein J5N97_018502 [Dioscorea zingiberensis]